VFSATSATFKLVLNCKSKTFELSITSTYKKTLRITNFLGYISTKNYQNWLINNNVIAKIRRVAYSFFLKHSVKCSAEALHSIAYSIFTTITDIIASALVVPNFPPVRKAMMYFMM